MMDNGISAIYITNNRCKEKSMRIISLLSAGLLITCYVATANADETKAAITVIGEGSVSAAPDMAVVSTGVMTRSDTASEALSRNNSAMTRVMSVLKQHGIDQKDIQTSGFNVQPEFNYKNREQPPAITGYRVTNGLTVKVHDLSVLATVLDALVQAGSNQISGVQFTFKDASSLKDQARRNAYRNARARAELYAEEANVKLGTIQLITEGPISVPFPRRAQRMATAEAVSQVPIALGENVIRVTVTVMFNVLY
jgi:uncharacterized protein YggE